MEFIPIYASGKISEFRCKYKDNYLCGSYVTSVRCSALTYIFYFALTIDRAYSKSNLLPFFRKYIQKVR